MSAQCSWQCFGVMEFRGIITETGQLQKAERTEENIHTKSPEREILIYVCSKCAKIEQRANTSLQDYLFKRKPLGDAEFESFSRIII